MDSFTVAPELRGTKGDIIAARIEVPNAHCSLTTAQNN